MYINRLKNLIAQNGKTFIQAAEAIGMSESGFHAAAKKDTFKAKDIIKLADWLGVPLSLIYKDEIESFKSISEEYSQFNTPKVSYESDLEQKKLIKEMAAMMKKMDERINKLENK